MRPFHVLVALVAILGLVAGCGDDSSTPQDKAPLASADGPVVRYPFTLKEGDGVRLTTQAEVRVTAAGAQDRSQAVTVGTTLDLRCTEVTPAGDRVARLRMLHFGADTAPATDADEGVDGSMTIGSDRLAKAVELGGQPLPHKRPLANPFVTGGLSIYMPLTVGGMRVGETVVLPSEMPSNVLPPPVQQAVEASDTRPMFRGVYTLLGTREHGGVLVGDFDVDISLEFAGTVTMGPGDVEVQVDMSCKGRQSFALSTGLPVGSGSSRVVQRVAMKLGNNESVMRTNADIRAECEPLPEEDPPRDG